MSVQTTAGASPAWSAICSLRHTSSVLRGPANRPAFFLPMVLALTVVIVLALRGHWLTLGVIVVGAALLVAWDRFGPRPRAGQLRRRWPWHDD
jgi:hypothetical protein